MKKMLLLATSLIVLSAPAYATSVNDSIWLGGSGSFRNWRAVGQDELIIWSSPKKPYLVKIWRPYRSLRFVHAIGINSRTSRLTKFDSIYVDGQRLPIKSITAIEPEFAKELRWEK